MERTASTSHSLMRSMVTAGCIGGAEYSARGSPGPVARPRGGMPDAERSRPRRERIHVDRQPKRSIPAHDRTGEWPEPRDEGRQRPNEQLLGLPDAVDADDDARPRVARQLSRHVPRHIELDRVPCALVDRPPLAAARDARRAALVG